MPISSLPLFHKPYQKSWHSLCKVSRVKDAKTHEKHKEFTGKNMENTGYITLSRQLALQQKMDVISNNIANMSTNGYKSQHMVFAEYVMQPETGTPGDAMSMVMDYGQFKDISQGPMSVTGNPLDIAIEGDGFFAVQTDNGVRYTRGGSFSLNADREIVTPAGLQVLDEGGNPIVIPDNTDTIFVKANGSIGTEAGEIALLQISNFEDLQALEPEGNTLFRTNQSPIPAEQFQVVQGSIEESNVNPIEEMTAMIDVSRAYQMTMRILQDEHERERTAIQRLSRLA